MVALVFQKNLFWYLCFVVFPPSQPPANPNPKPCPEIVILVDSRDDYKAQRVHARPQAHLGPPTSPWDILGLVFFHSRDLGGGSCVAEFWNCQTQKPA